MGIIGSIYAISAEQCEAAKKGDAANFGPAPLSGVYLDKAWHAIHYLVTGDSTRTFLLSGTQIPQVPEFEQHCEVHAPVSIEALHRRLSERSVEQIMANFDPAAFNELKNL